MSSKTIELYQSLKRLPKPQFNELCLYLQEKYGYDLSYIAVDKAPAESANQLLELVKQNPQGLNHLEWVLEKFEVSDSTIKTESMTSDKKSYAISGQTKIKLCQRLGADWQDLADYLEIPAYRRRQFQQGRECQAIWEWLEERKQLHTLKEVLGNLNRQDLVELLTTDK
jgi:hypothetical protein